MNKRYQNDQGFVLPLVLVAVAIMAAGVGYVLTRGLSELQANTQNQDYQLCILTAKNAMAILQAELEEDINYTGTATKVADENGGYYQIRVSVLSEKLRFVEVDSEFGSYHQSFNGEIELMTAAAPKSRIIRLNWKLLGEV